MKALIDGDIVAYRSAFAAERVQYTIWNEDGLQSGIPLWVGHGKTEADSFIKQFGLDPEEIFIQNEKVFNTPEVAKMAAKAIMEAILSDLEVSEYQVYLTGEGNFRHEIATIKGYKAHRPPKPRYLGLVREYLLTFWSAKIIDGMEADDELGMVQCMEDNTIIVSIDKDLKMIPGWHYNFVKREREYIDETTGYKNFYRQCITGDSTDNIPGLFNITGKKATKKLLADFEALDTIEGFSSFVLDLYKGYENELNEIAQLLWILREPRYG